MNEFHSLLRQYWGYDDFRGIQLDIIKSITAGHDTLGLMPTGGGKSITFQVPALAMEGMTIVVTPLIALMKDQVENLCRRGIRAGAIYAGQSHDEVQKHLDNSVLGAYKLLYVSPERLETDLFKNKVRRMKVSFITVDEAHCISQWGYDFRPAYLRIAELRKLLPDVPVLALTATATPAVVDDICDKLEFPKKNRAIFRMSFERKNLRYIVRKTENKYGELLHILRSVPGSVIIYTRSRRGTGDLARQLRDDGFTTFYYHAGLTNVDKDVRQRAWQEGRVRIMVATNAFGMGIDKPDVRLVIHMDPPDSLEAYFQEAGRAGRDGETAYAVLLYNNGDHGKMLRRIPETFPEKDYVAKIYDKLAYFFSLAVGDGYMVRYEFNLEKFCYTYKLFPLTVVNALNLLTQAGYIDFQMEEDNVSRVMFLAKRDDLYYKLIPEEADAVASALLRLYSGLFSNYVFIDEAHIAYLLKCDVDHVYEMLKLLNRLRIIHYIPHKRIPHITFLTRRVERARLPREVYEVRRDNYITRINSILEYASQVDVCRSRYLLDYFGDTAAKDCGCCDICLERHNHNSEKSIVELSARLLAVLADGEPHDSSELILNGESSAKCREAIRYLFGEGKIEREGLKIRLRR